MQLELVIPPKSTPRKTEVSLTDKSIAYEATEAIVWQPRPKEPSPEEKAREFYKVEVTRGAGLYSTDGWDGVEAIAIPWLFDGIGSCKVIKDEQGCFDLIQFSVGEKLDFFYAPQLLKVEKAR